MEVVNDLFDIFIITSNTYTGFFILFFNYFKQIFKRGRKEEY